MQRLTLSLALFLSLSPQERALALCILMSSLCTHVALTAIWPMAMHTPLIGYRKESECLSTAMGCSWEHKLN